jgi:hypothetical protein
LRISGVSIWRMVSTKCGQRSLAFLGMEPAQASSRAAGLAVGRGVDATGKAV